MSFETSIYFFGGYTRKGGEYFSDIFEYKTVENEWIDLKAPNPPSPRTDHTFIRHGHCFYVYGGRDEMHIFSDIYEYNIRDNIWRYVKC